MKPQEVGPKIKKIVRGQVLWDRQTLDLYSVDASSYIIRPSAVVIPRDEQDLTGIVKYASKNNIPLTARGAGTGLVGSALGRGIIVDLKNFNKIRVSLNHVVAGAGVFKGQLDTELEKQNRFFPPNPSIGPYCTVGGMVATNASGSHSLKYGSTIDNLLGVRIITSNGEVTELPSNSRLACDAIGIIRPDVQKKFPCVSKNSCGYRLDKVTGKSSLHKIISGSEGTLGIIISAKLRTLPVPKERALIMIAYKTIRHAAVDSARIVSLKPSALEIVDDNIMKYLKIKLPKGVKCLLFVEFDHDVKKGQRDLRKMVYNGKIVKTLAKNDEVKEWWNFRNSALSYSLKSITAKQILPTIIEDATVPVEKLTLLVDIINKIVKKYKLRFVLYGHAGNGNLHIRPILKSKNKKTIKNIAKEFFSQVITIGGCITGEHGDGLARSEFVKLQYSKDVYSTFKKIKSRFDPNNILNPGKIITSKSTIIRNLRI